MKTSGKYIANLNCSLKGIKLDTIVDFIHSDHQEFIVTTNKVASSSNLSIVEKYIKNTNAVDSNDIQLACFLQSKLYLKILGILYLIKSTNTPIDSSVMEAIIKNTHIFNNICITSKPYIIKVSLKSDMAIVWINIWDSQSGTSAKTLINHYFNVKSYITTI